MYTCTCTCVSMSLNVQLTRMQGFTVHVQMYVSVVKVYMCVCQYTNVLVKLVQMYVYSEFCTCAGPRGFAVWHVTATMHREGLAARLGKSMIHKYSKKFFDYTRDSLKKKP